MKNLKRFLVVFSFAFVTLLMVTSCSKISKDVKLNSLVGSVDEVVELKSYVVKMEDGNGEEEITVADETPKIEDYQYIVLDENEQVFTLSIILDNEKDYHIFDFKLECTDENAMVYLDDGFYPLTEQKSINWKGDTNKRYDIKLSLTKSLEDVKLEITGIFFASRETAKNHYSADLNNKGTFNIFKTIDPVDFELEKIENGQYIFNYNIIDERVKNINIIENNSDDTIELDVENKKLKSSTFKFAYDCEYELTEELKVKKTIQYDGAFDKCNNSVWKIEGKIVREMDVVILTIKENKLVQENELDYKATLYENGGFLIGDLDVKGNNIYIDLFIFSLYGCQMNETLELSFNGMTFRIKMEDLKLTN